MDPFPQGDWSSRRCELVQSPISSTSGVNVSFSRPDIDSSLGGITDTQPKLQPELIEGTRQFTKVDKVTNGSVVNLVTLGIKDMLQQYSVPEHINYVSLDVEGGLSQLPRYACVA